MPTAKLPPFYAAVGCNADGRIVVWGLGTTRAIAEANAIDGGVYGPDRCVGATHDIMGVSIAVAERIRAGERDAVKLGLAARHSTPDEVAR